MWYKIQSDLNEEEQKRKQYKRGIQKDTGTELKIQGSKGKKFIYLISADRYNEDKDDVITNDEMEVIIPVIEAAKAPKAPQGGTTGTTGTTGQYRPNRYTMRF